MKEERDGEFIYIDWEDQIFFKNPCRCTVSKRHVSLLARGGKRGAMEGNGYDFSCAREDGR